MKILTAEQMRRIDRLTVEKAGRTNRELMENAGRSVADFLLHELQPRGHVTILCGKGNNGGDALVAARHLLARGVELQVVLLADPADLKGDAKANCDAFLQAGGRVAACSSAAEWKKQAVTWLDCDVLVDGLLGTGLSGPVRGFLAEVIAAINTRPRPARVLAVDIPSGLPSDSGEPMGEAVRATATVTFTAPKRGQIFPPNSERVGRLAVAPIGSPEELYANDPALDLNLITPRSVARLPLERAAAAHKGDFGHVLLVAGSRGKAGAAALSGKAGLRMGAGLMTVATAASSLPVVASHVPEIMTEPLAETDAGSISGRALDYGRFSELCQGKAVLGLGPGLTTHPETAQFVRTVVEQSELPLVLDADALNALVGQLEVLRRRRAQQLVLTPHPGEMARLLGSTSGEVQRQRIEVTQKFAREYGVFVILKGHRTLVGAPDGQVYVNPTGNAGMATGGSGDVLTGMVAAAVAQWREADLGTALCLAVYLHGLAGDRAAERLGPQAMIASDITESLPLAWAALRDRIERDDPGSYYLLP